MTCFNRHIRGSNPYAGALAALLLLFALVRVEQYAGDPSEGVDRGDSEQIAQARLAVIGSAFKGSRVIVERIPERDVDDGFVARRLSDGREHPLPDPAGKRAPRGAWPASLSLFLLHEALLL